MKVGYIKNRTNEKATNSLIRKMEKEKVEKIIVEITSDNDNDQKALLECLENMSSENGDMLVIESLDDLGESISDVISISKLLEERSIGLQVLEKPFPIINEVFNNEKQRLLRKWFISLLTWAEKKDREEIKKRQSRGAFLARAKQHREKGRPKKYSRDAVDPKDRETFFAIVTMLEEGVPISRISEELGVSRNTIYTIKNEEKKATEKG